MLFVLLIIFVFPVLQKLVCLCPYQTHTYGGGGQPGNLLIRQSEALDLVYWILCSKVCRTRKKENLQVCYCQLHNSYNHDFRNENENKRDHTRMFPGLIFTCPYSKYKNSWLVSVASVKAHDLACLHSGTLWSVQSFQVSLLHSSKVLQRKVHMYKALKCM